MHDQADQAPEPTGRFLRMPDVEADIGLSKATLNRMVRRGEFPPKRRLGPGSVGWRESDIEAWKRSRPTATTTV